MYIVFAFVRFNPSSIYFVRPILFQKQKEHSENFERKQTFESS